MNGLKCFLCALLLSAAAASQPLNISEREAQAAGQRIWRNECSGSVEGLTSWNDGEGFASLGIGHFIWYPPKLVGKGRFEESFPRLVTYLGQHGATLPVWLKDAPPCPWSSKEEFRADFNSPRMRELRNLLKNTVTWQARFIAERLENALPQMLETLPEDQRASINRRFHQVYAAPGGVYALLDYVNFKGEGTRASERYAGQGWGMLQVLQEMKNSANSARAFGDAADRVLTRRVRNAPPGRGEDRWLQGWRNRVSGYGQGAE